MRLKKTIKPIIFLCLAFALLWLLRGLILPFVCEDPLPILKKHLSSGGALTDRNGRLLRVVSDEREALSVYIPPPAIPRNSLMLLY